MAKPVRHLRGEVRAVYFRALTRSAVARSAPGQSALQRDNSLRFTARKRSRTALAYGGLAPALDTGSGVAMAAERYWVEQVTEYAPHPHRRSRGRGFLYLCRRNFPAQAAAA